MPDKFQIATLTPGLLQPSIALATHRAGETGILDFEFAFDSAAAIHAIRKFSNTLQASFGVRLSGDMPGLLDRIIADPPPHLNTIVLTATSPHELSQRVALLCEREITTLLEVTCLDQAIAGQAIGVSGLVARGHESGGRIGNETTFILLQRLQAECRLPVWAHGGIGIHTAAACAAGGAAGIVLDVQLALTRESPYPEGFRSRIASMDGSETICLGDQIGETWRIHFRPGNRIVKDLQEIELRLAHDGGRSPQEILAEWRQAIAARAGWDPEQNVLLLGQDGAFAASLAERFRTVGGVLRAIRESIQDHCDTAVRLRPLAEASPLAQDNGTRYPILQGPMTRVSDVPEFAGRVAESGALPFLALALLRGPEVRSLLAEAQRRMGTMPWGVGILGFVPPELRQEQMDVICEFRPPFALIAGGRPDQARALEQKGISSYLHVPSPGLLRMFVQQGARRFIFEGRECGGHVGPRTSFVLWNQMVDVLLNAPELREKPEEFHVVFAAGIHDALSASMVSVIAAPLAGLGARIGALIGTAYLFTEEVVASGAILETFQEQARECRNTVLLETGPGHSTRCVDTPFATTFASEKKRLLAAGRPAEEIRMVLEELNLGRLRIASKGVTRHPSYGQDPSAPKLLEIEKSEQLSQGMYMIGQVAALRDRIITAEALHHEVAVEGSNRLESLAGRTWHTPVVPQAESPSDVAIIGMACMMPKAPDLQTYWENILQKVNAVGEVPKDRFDWELYFDADPKTRDKIYSRWGGFLDEHPFDPMQYGMPPASLRSIEPNQLLTLEVVRAALTDAGYMDRPFARERTSVILGAGGGAADLGLGYGARSFVPTLEHLPEFQGRTKEIIDQLEGRLPEWTEDSFAGILNNVAAGRVANRFDLGGSNYTVDAACASSLAAVSLALKELESRTSDMVVVGGIDTLQNPFTYLCFSKTHALSPRGRCRTFDETADGIAISEGIAIMVFKRLADAERDGDRIYAVIKGAGSSSDGKDRGLTAPRPEGQARALKRAYAKAGVSPASVGLIEAHGTGTVAGDQAEVQALTQVFSEAQAIRQSCAIGSVKSMVGHTKCTAGAAGLIKTALALHHKVLPPTIGVEKPNTKARFPETPFFVNSEPKPWLENLSGEPRRAGVSAFGFGGTNFHIVVEEYTGDPVAARQAPSRRWSDELFVWKAATRQELAGIVDNWSKALAADVKPELRDLAYTAWQATGKAAGSLRLAILASSVEDLKQKLESAKQGLAETENARINDPKGIYFSQEPLAAKGKLAFLFPGQGSQYPYMLQDLLLHFPEMRKVFEQSVQVLNEKLEQPLTSYVFPPPSFTREEELVYQKALTRTNVAQPALGAASLAMYGLLQELGLRPEMAAGHSYGEYVALAVAGSFDTETLIALSEARGRFIVEGAGEEPGTMAAVEGNAAAVSEVLKKLEGVSVANANGPRQTVIAGSRAAVERAVKHFVAQGTTARTIPVACAFHSPLVAGAQNRLAEFFSTVKVSEPAAVTVYSNTTAKPYPTEPQAIAGRLVDHLVRPVEFVQEIEAMYEDGARVFVEVGPRSVLTNLVEQILTDRPRLAVASNQIGKPGLTQLLHMLGQVAAQGYELKLDRLYRDRSPRRLDMNALERECAPRPLPASVWMVNGARVRPLKEIPVVKSQAAPMPVSAVEKQPVAGAASSDALHSNGVPAPPVAVSTEPMPASFNVPVVPASGAPLAPVANAPAAPEGAPEVMMQFQQMMTRFLETQKTVMLAYLGGDSVALPSPAVPPAPVFTAPEPRPGPVREVAAPLVTPPPPVPPQPSAPAGPDRKELTAQLLAIVSERTGYPAEMLDLNLDLEADLGIDSIKRVEILGTFQQAFVAAGIAVEEGLMEKLSGVRTLQGIVNGISGQLPAPPAAVRPSTQPSPAPVSSGIDKKELTAQLLAIVSERTGYPAEMLDLNLDLEADLGIDSIKRVEILGTFQQAFAAAGIVAEEGLMEKLSGVRTLQGIVDQLVVHTGVESALTPVTTTAQHATQAPSGVDKRELTAQLLTIVSERTGYPPEMLDLNLDLEADLGIDSIKRVEILGTFQQTFATAGITVEEGLMEKLSSVRTLQGIIDQVTEKFDTVPVSAPVAAAPAGLDRQGLTAQLLAIVSERTGYPAEMLDLNLDLEADLGIDSIKRVEILGTFQQTFAAAGITVGEGLMEKLSSVRTLQGILDGIFEQVMAAPASPVPDPAPQSPGVEGVEGPQIRRYRLAAVEALPSSGWKGLVKHRPILITHDGQVVAMTLTAELLEQGYKVALVRQGQSVQELDSGSYTADLCAPESVTELMALVSQRQGPPGAVVHLLPLHGEADFEAHDDEGWREQLRLGVKSLFHIAKASGRHLREAAAEGGASLIAATAMGGTFLSDLPAEAAGKFPDHGAIAGLMKTLALEWPEVRVRAVDLNLEESSNLLARHLSTELHSGDDLMEVGYDGQWRITLQSVEAPLNAEGQGAVALDSSSVVLITGGARGITARAAERLARLYRPTLVLAGRSPLPVAKEAPETAGITTPKEVKAALMQGMRARGESVTPALVERAYARLQAEREVRDNLAALRRAGAQVHYHPVDVRDTEAFGAFIEGIYQTFGRLDGVIHGAGVIEDKLIENKTPDSFDRVFDTKVNSAFVLSRKLRPETLQFLVFFSSVSGRFGNRGQGDYAAANEVLNKMAVCLDRAWPGRVVAINWGPWDTEGMVSAEVRKQFAERGVSLITPQVGLRMLEEELQYSSRGDAEIVIGGAVALSGRKTAASPQSWPLLHGAVVSTAEGVLEVVREINVAQDIYLLDHLLDGQPVLPLAVATELMTETVSKGWPALQVASIRELRALHGIVLESGARTVRVTAKQQPGGSRSSQTIALEIAGTEQPQRLHYRALIELTDRLSEALSLNVPALQDARAFSMSVPELYHRWLFHGPLFQGIQRVERVGAGGISALLSVSSPDRWLAGAPSGQWQIDPMMFDSALQLLVLWGRQHWDMTPLPTGFQSFRRFHAPAASKIRCELRILPNTGGQKIHSDITFADADTGRVLAVLENMQGACSKALNRLAGGKVLVATGSQS